MLKVIKGINESGLITYTLSGYPQIKGYGYDDKIVGRRLADQIVSDCNPYSSPKELIHLISYVNCITVEALMKEFSIENINLM